MKKSIVGPKSLIHRHQAVFICLVLVVTTFAVYYPVLDYDFVNFDDPLYLEENRFVRLGLAPESIIWAFTDGIATTGYWAPLTLLTLLWDSQIYGMQAGGYHLTNLLLHCINTLLLFVLFRRITGAIWSSALVAMLFAIHPLHVESVAWVSERKDVLSTLFWVLTLWAYAKYTEAPGAGRYMIAIILFILGLTAKPMLVTLPFILLLLDYWPLGRFPVRGTANRKIYLRKATGLVLEKLPFMIIALVAALGAYLGQHAAGTVTPLTGIGLETRISNTLIAYSGYLRDMFWPVNLAVLYPHPGDLPVWMPLLAAVLLCGVTIVVLRRMVTWPFLFLGWFWYLLTLAPVSGIVVIGPHATADRYTYVPLIGLFVMIAWGVPKLMARFPGKKIWLATSSLVALSALTVLTHKQIQHWENSFTLFTHTLAVTSNNPIAHNNLGLALEKRGNTNAAIEHYREALRIKPDYLIAYNNIGNALLKQGNIDAAIRQYREALYLKPDYAKAHNNIGNAFQHQGNIDDAIKHYRKALRLKPDYEGAHNNLGLALEKRGNIDEAMGHYLEAIHINPGSETAHNNTGNALLRQGLIDDAIKHYLAALRIKPDYEEAHNGLASAFYHQGDLTMAIRHFRKAIEINPNYSMAKNNLEIVLMLQKNSQ